VKAANLPRLLTTSYSTDCPAFNDDKPARSIVEMCTNTSLPAAYRHNEAAAFCRIEPLHAALCHNTFSKKSEQLDYSQGDASVASGECGGCPQFRLPLFVKLGPERQKAKIGGCCCNVALLRPQAVQRAHRRGVSLDVLGSQRGSCGYTGYLSRKKEAPSTCGGRRLPVIPPCSDKYRVDLSNPVMISAYRIVIPFAKIGNQLSLG
jgi:hypothetical protein